MGEKLGSGCERVPVPTNCLVFFRLQETSVPHPPTEGFCGLIACVLPCYPYSGTLGYINLILFHEVSYNLGSGFFVHGYIDCLPYITPYLQFPTGCSVTTCDFFKFLSVIITLWSFHIYSSISGYINLIMCHKVSYEFACGFMI